MALAYNSIPIPHVNIYEGLSSVCSLDPARHLYPCSLALVEPESHLSLRLNTDGEVNHGFLVAATCLGQERAPDIPELDAGGHSATGRITPTPS